MLRIQLIGMSSYAKNELQMCSVANINVDDANSSETFSICNPVAKFSQIHPVYSLLSVTKKDLS